MFYDTKYFGTLGDDDQRKDVIFLKLHFATPIKCIHNTAYYIIYSGVDDYTFIEVFDFFTM